MTELGKNVSLSGQCFPVRSLTRNNVYKDNSGGGAWLVAYKAEQRRRFKAVLCRDPDVALPAKPATSKQSFLKSNKSGEEDIRRRLDGLYLMKICHVNDPLDLCTIHISGRGLEQVKEEDFALFENVIHIDAGDNNLQLMHFRTFPCLKELELPLNDISGTVRVSENDFLWLETLDLSCNKLTSNDIVSLGVLPALKVLHLTGNHLNELPQDLSRSYSLSNGDRKPRFASLEKLWLDQNDLKDTKTFTSLAGLKRLTYLNLAGNKIASVPYLKLLESKTKIPREDVFQNSKQFPNSNMDNILDSELANVNHRISTLENMLHSEENDSVGPAINDVKNNAAGFVYQYGQDLPVLPFPSLRHLSLANNQIKEEEGLLALSTWPKLDELVVWGNPVSSCGKKGLPTVAYHLGLLAGIQVSRHKPSKKLKSLTSLTVCKNPRRVKDLPPITHNRKLLMLDAPKHPELGYETSNELRPLPPITAPCKESQRSSPSPKRVYSAPPRPQEEKTRRVFEESRSTRHIKTEGLSSSVETTCMDSDRRNEEAPVPEDRVFLTQIDDIDRAEVLFFNDDELKKPVNPEKPTTGEHKKVQVPKKYRGYEDLLNIDEEYADDIRLPADIHGNVTALQYALEHPLIFTEQTTKYRPKRRKKHSQVTTISAQKSSRKTAVEELGIILDKMRTHSKTEESNLGDVLNEYENSATKVREAKKLLNEVQTKYNEVRSQSLNSAALAADVMQSRGRQKLKSTDDLGTFKKRLDSRI